MKARVQIPAAFSEIFDPYRVKTYHGGRGSAKCLKKGTKIIMYSGVLKKVEDIVVGDILMGVNNKPRNVLSITSGEGMLYKINQTSGIDYVVNEEHILSLKKRKMTKSDFRINKYGNRRSPNGRYPSYPDITNINIKEWLTKSKRWRDSFRGYKNGLIYFRDKDVTIDPYFLGVWLGDGTSKTVGITTMDKEIVSYCSRYVKTFGLNTVKYRNNGSRINNKAHQYGFSKDRHVHKNPLYQRMVNYDIISNKHIPIDFIVNSEDKRLSLLAGIIDTDGHMKSNCYSIVQKNERLARDIKYLADTLGFKTNIRQVMNKCCNNGKIGKYWKVSISGNVYRIPCLLNRKVLHRRDVRPNKDFMLSQVSIEKYGNGEYFGFGLDGDKLFLLRDGTVSHNSESIGRYILADGAREQQNIVCGREYQASIKDSVHSMLEHLITDMQLDDFYQVLNNEIRGRNGTKIVFVGVRNNIQNIKSMHDINKFWGEEAQSFSQNSLDIIFPTIRAKGSELLFSMNPILEEDPAFQTLIANPQPNSLVREVNYMDNPFFPPELEELRLHHKEKYTEEKYNNIWLGKCLSAVEGAIFARELEAAAKDERICHVAYDPRYPVHTFWDLGHSDQTAIWFIQIVGFEYRIIDYYANSQEKMAHYIHHLQEQEYNYGTHYLPHDADHEQLGQEATIKEQAEDALGNVEVVPRVRLKAHAIDQARLVLAMSYFDKEKCADGLTCLRRQAFAINAETGRISKEPEHKIWSHGSDAYMTFGTAIAEHLIDSAFNVPQIPGYPHEPRERETPRLG